MKILVFQHISIEHPGSFRDVIAAQGHTMHAVELDEGDPIPPLDDYDVLLVMGGPMDVWEEDKHPWLIAEKSAIQKWVSAGRPYLGMCLGEQLLACAMGGTVALMTATPEVGLSQVTTTPDPIFAGVPALCACFQWHGAEVIALPPGARLLATSHGCRVQAFALGPCAYGLQFHMELTESTTAEWGSLPEYAASLEAAQGPGALGRLEVEVAAALPALQAAAKKLFSNFLEIAQTALAQKPAA
jgi:GMP synthase-like glutamine amidotransferase